ncbi:hypothetical protein V8C44DRAFT_307945 [Trichoderma aethiopicum]
MLAKASLGPGQLLAPTPTNGSMTREAPPRKRLQPGPGRASTTCMRFGPGMTKRPDDLVSTNRFDNLLFNIPLRDADRQRQSTDSEAEVVFLPQSPSLQHPRPTASFRLRTKHKRASVEFVSKCPVRGAGEASATVNCLLQIPCGSCTPTHERRTSNRVTWVALGPPGLPMPCLPCQALSGPRRHQTAFLATPHWSLAVGLSPQWGNPSITQSPSSAAKSAVARFFLVSGSGRAAFLRISNLLHLQRVAAAS